MKEVGSMKNKKRFLTALLLSAMTLSYSTLTGCSENNNEGVRAFKLEKQDLINSVSATGSVDGVHVDIENSQKTKAVKVNVREGDLVKKGDVLFEFDSTDLKEQYEKLSSKYEKEDDKIKYDQSINEDNLNAAKHEKQVKLAQAQRKIDEAISNRDDAYNKRDHLQNQYDSLFDERNSLTDQLNNASTDEEYAEFDARIEEASIKLAQIETELGQVSDSLSTFDNLVNDAKDFYSNVERECDSIISNAENVIENEKFITNSVEKDELKDLKEQMEKCVVTAPVSGVIVAPQVIEGTVPMTEILATIVDTSDLSVNVDISEYDISNVNMDMDVIIKTAATGTDEIKGNIKRISHINSVTDAGAVYPVEIDIDESSLEKDLFIGMTARTEIITSRTDKVFAVPYDIFPENILNPDEKYIMVAEPDGDSYITRKINVETGEEASYYMEIISDELEEDMIVISEPTGLKENKKINVVIE